MSKETKQTLGKLEKEAQEAVKRADFVFKTNNVDLLSFAGVIDQCGSVDLGVSLFKMISELFFYTKEELNHLLIEEEDIISLSQLAECLIKNRTENMTSLSGSVSLTLNVEGGLKC